MPNEIRGGNPSCTEQQRVLKMDKDLNGYMEQALFSVKNNWQRRVEAAFQACIFEFYAIHWPKRKHAAKTEASVYRS